MTHMLENTQSLALTLHWVNSGLTGIIFPCLEHLSGELDRLNLQDQPGGHNKRPPGLQPITTRNSSILLIPGGEGWATSGDAGTILCQCWVLYMLEISRWFCASLSDNNRLWGRNIFFIFFDILQFGKKCNATKTKEHMEQMYTCW